jgi:hypothetical protein
MINKEYEKLEKISRKTDGKSRRSKKKQVKEADSASGNGEKPIV